LGHGDENDVHEPQLVEALTAAMKVKQFSAGANHVLVLTGSSMLCGLDLISLFF
jgi:alpha-tubulin suppressor-like RCC1 family protein